MWLKLLEESQADGAPLKLPGFPVASLDDHLGQVGQSGGVEAITLGTGTADELIEERDGLLTGILALVLHHAGLGVAGEGSQWLFGSTVQPSVLMHRLVEGFHF